MSNSQKKGPAGGPQGNPVKQKPLCSGASAQRRASKKAEAARSEMMSIGFHHMMEEALITQYARSEKWSDEETQDALTQLRNSYIKGLTKRTSKSKKKSSKESRKQKKKNKKKKRR